MKQFLLFLTKSILYTYIVYFFLMMINIIPSQFCNSFYLENYRACHMKNDEFTANDLFRESKEFKNHYQLIYNDSDDDKINDNIIKYYINSRIYYVHEHPIYDDTILHDFLEKKIQNKKYIYLQNYFELNQNKWSDEIILTKAVFYLNQLKEDNSCSMFDHGMYEYYKDFTEKNKYHNILLLEEKICQQKRFI